MFIPKECQWVGSGETCNQPVLDGTSYCKAHHRRVYLILPVEMADYIIEKELSSLNPSKDQA